VLHAVDVRGLRVAVRRRGEGEPVLLIHGGMSDSREWGLQVEDLARDHDVVAVDVLGCGGSSDPAHLLAETLDALGVVSAHVFGTTGPERIGFGGGICIHQVRHASPRCS
jgi:pimeloyl-ACP methyl ester carboxylesterase